MTLAKLRKHNSRKEQGSIELRVNVSDGIRQANHGGCVVGQARIEGVVIGLGCWIRIKFLVVFAVKGSYDSLPGGIFDAKDDLTQVFLGVFDINWWLFLEIRRVIGLIKAGQAQADLIDLGHIVVNFAAALNMDHHSGHKILNLAWLGIPDIA